MSFKTGQKLTLTSGVGLSIGVGVVNSPVLVKADAGNSGKVYLGDVTVSTASGFLLDPGEQALIQEVGKLDDIYIVGTSGNQRVYFIAYDEA